MIPTNAQNQIVLQDPISPIAIDCSKVQNNQIVLKQDVCGIL